MTSSIGKPGTVRATFSRIIDFTSERVIAI